MTLTRFTVFLVLALTLALMAALTSCGCGASVQDSGGNTANGSDTGTTNGNTGTTNGNTGSGSANGTTPGNDSSMDDIIQGGQDIVGGVDDAIDDITGNGTHDGGVTYGDMLDDGTVTDHDGTLGNEPTARRR